jgi:pimeloyl-ACP methyl ester carboxylesterase
MTPTHAVSINSVSLHVLEEGNGPPLVFGHGYLFDHTMYDGQARDLRRDYRVVRFDWRAHGSSGMPDGRWTMLDQGHDYVRVMDALAIERAVVIGQSMGGMAALQLALHQPERVSGLVLIDTSAAAEALHRRIRYAGLVLAVGLFGMRRWILQQAAAVSFCRSFRRRRPEVVRYWMHRWAQLDAEYVRRTVDVPVGRPSMVDRLPEISAPTLVIYGAQDQTTPLSDSRQLVDGMPNARLEILADTGHMSPIERPEEVTRLIRGFLQELGS